VLQRLGVVVLQVQVDAEAGAERSGEQAAARGGTYQRERVQVYLDGARRGPFVDHDVDAVVFHGRVEVFLHDRRQAVNLVDEQHVVLLQRGEDAGQVAGLVEHGTAGELEAYAELVGDNVAQRGLSQSGRPVQKRVVEGLAAIFGGFHEHFEVLHDFLLSAEVVELERAQGVLEILLG
jgi:hypothetical protein